MEAYTPGLIGSVYCRTRYIDDALYTALESGFSQVVLLGAGFDSRAYRIRGIERAHVFELDHPTMQCVKQQRVAKLLGALPAYTPFASIDFERQNLGEILTAVGWHPDRKTFFIWEGVTQYLQAEAVDRTFRWISCAAATGSVIVFTYVDQGSIDRTACSDAAQKILVAMHQAGTPWISGLDSSRLSHYLIERGLELVEQVGAPDYRARYLKPHGRRMSIFEGERVVLARVVGAA
jgi:methyltransferase (TIGR00027 family)